MMASTWMVTESRVRISWGGTSKVTVRMSTWWIMSSSHKDHHDTRPHLAVTVHARQDEEDTRTSGPSFEKTTQSEDHRSFILLDNFDRDEEAEGEGDQDQEEGEDSDQDGAQTGPVRRRASCH